MRLSLRSAVLAVLVVLAMAAPSSAATQHRPQTRVMRDCLHLVVKPRQIQISCGDGNLFVTRAHWRTWQHSQARGHGRLWWNDCEPNCAAGHFHHTGARLRLSDPVRTTTQHGKHVWAFSKIHTAVWRHGRWHYQTIYLNTDPV